MKPDNTALLKAFTAVCAILLSTGSEAFIRYSAAPIAAQVVDSETGEPIPGVVVLAHWELRGGGHGQSKGELMILETKTDADGRFSFPAWGPKTVWDPDARLWDADPAMTLLKQGYAPRTVLNSQAVGPIDTTRSLRTSRWDGKRIEIKNLHGDEKAAAQAFDLDEIRRLVGSGTDCEWKEMPLTVAYVLREGPRLRSLGLNVYTFDLRSFSNQQSCGSALRWAEGLPK